MWSDNYVTGDNIYLRELQSFFFDVCGMMSITHYGCIGDGRKDNYGNLQAAIDDARRRGISFLYVPYGKFIYTGELINMEGIIFIGNPHAKIVNIRTGDEIEIKQFGLPGIDITNYYTKEEINTLLSENYYTKEEIGERNYTKGQTNELLNGKQDNLTAGDNITIVDNVISAVDQAFFTCPFPTTWSGTETSRTGTNDYGTWSVSTDTSPFGIGEHNIGEVFDDSLTSLWAISDGVTSLNKYIMIELPTDTKIKPTQLKLAYSSAIDVTTSPAVFQGYNADTEEWETLYTFDTAGGGPGVWTVTASLDTDKYYTKFRVYNVHNKTGMTGGNIYEIQISAGYIKGQEG